ncbi:MAG: hypothetical protein WCL00_11730 [Bacteroidota bacterium]
MKTRIILTVPILLFQFNLIIANNPGEVLSSKPGTISQLNLLSSTPSEATFTDLVPDPAPIVLSLAPVTPREATFGDEELDALETNSIPSLSPSTPVEADFEETIPASGYGSTLAPITPVEASFEEII